MRDVAPLVRHVVVHHDDALGVAVVASGDADVQLRECVAGNRLAPGRHFVHTKLVFRELRLTEHGGLDVLEVAPEQRQPRRSVRDVLEHVIDEQRLVERRGDLGDERRVISRLVRLRLVRVVAVHRVTELVRQRADVVVLTEIVQQDVWMHLVRAAVRVGP